MLIKHHASYFMLQHSSHRVFQVSLRAALLNTAPLVSSGAATLGPHLQGSVIPAEI